MATSVYFDNFSNAMKNEKRLFEDLLVESIKMMGHNVRYLPREAYDVDDDILGENPTAKFSRAYTVEMFLANIEGYEGDGDFFSKFGLEIRETSNFIVSRRSFEKYIPSSIATRPREGDLIYVPTLQQIFEIKFVENELLFKSFGNREAYIYEMRCETFRFSNENIETGDEEVDDIELLASYTVRLQLGAGSGNYHLGEMVYQGANLTSSSISAKDRTWDPVNKTLDVINTKGEFVTSNAVVGHDSTASYAIATKDDLADVVIDDDSDNRVIQQEASTFVDLSEINPFGVP